jgi:membrane-associated phospholipid phosphatase
MQLWFNLFTRFVFLLIIGTKAYSQTKDSSTLVKKIVRSSPKWIAPAACIGIGMYTWKDNGIYSSYDAYNDIQLNSPNFHSKVDNYIQYAPLATVYALGLFKNQTSHRLKERIVVTLKAEVIMAITVLTLKYTTHVMRPNQENDRSFPSGHTAQAFLGAYILQKELGHKSILYTIGGYTVATTVGLMAMYNNRHWMSDVWVGAGLGLLSAKIAYWTQKKLSTKETIQSWNLVPYYQGKQVGFFLSKRF